ncbi:MAG: MarR family transcriptional regulator [Acidimicrobiales bacterium]
MQTSQKDEIGGALLRASRALVGIAARSLADIDEVTLPQFRALVVVSSPETTTVSTLAHALDIHPTTATRLCDRLVDKELLRRDPDPEDRRTVELHLSAAGRQLVKRVTARRQRDLAAIAARMPAPAARAAIVALGAFADAAGESPEATDLFGWAAPTADP